MQAEAVHEHNYSLKKLGGRVGIVLVNYNGMRFMPACLETLERIDYLDYRIVVVDNASHDGSADWLAENYPDITLIRLAENTGVVGGNNTGMKWCLANDCDYVLLLNNDTEVEPEFLSRLMNHADPQTLLVPKIFYYDNRNILNSHFGRFDFWRGLNVEMFFDSPESELSEQLCIGTMSNTCAMLLPRTVLDKIGLMDENYFMYFDDNDLIHRAVLAGTNVKFIPDSVIYHKESSSSGGQRISPFTLYYLTRNRLYFMFKFQRNPLALAYFLVYFMAGRSIKAVKYLVKGDRKLLKASINAVIDFVLRKKGAAPAERYS